ncbi:NAD(P)-dependent oxidoreductase [Mycolicibacterium porcinum]|uniref:NAD(P)-dependent oxidoreductase n=1 Tax=Mycolicibacterium porcinum TaxID=39693 RepID=A0AAW5TC63_9MYCO|nr:NAD(P)-binding domain-containing protein [Mycolicibacterium porcinum]MCV7392258.1 NAD(P)-dependent oxidoreductase [Mycolicibacterium porcinum]ORB37329.1 6-phosphogluconate dehydrogenase [Mycolicibacterium porcinum]CDO29106.1 oxidoreductase [Mycolicibacterium vulneris]
MTTTHPSVSFLGLGAMGSQLARTALNAGYPTSVWNRTAARVSPLVEEGADALATPAEALGADLVVVCLFDQASVHEVLDPVADRLAGRRLLNLTTTSPEGARELARWAAGHGAEYLDGGIMATPEMIATPQSAILYSGSAAVFEDHRTFLELWGSAEYFGDDPGMASLYDLALLSAMYVMFAGFVHGAAMVGAAGVPAKEFAARTAAWLPALMPAIAEYATVIDGGDYTVPGQQSLYFSDLTDIVNASRDQGISTEVIDMVQRLIHRQIDAGHGDEGFARIFESVKNGAAA